MKGERVYVAKGQDKGAYGLVIHADRDSLHLVTDDGEDVYTRHENVVRQKKVTK